MARATLICCGFIAGVVLTAALAFHAAGSAFGWQLGVMGAVYIAAVLVVGKAL